MFMLVYQRVSCAMIFEGIIWDGSLSVNIYIYLQMPGKTIFHRVLCQNCSEYGMAIESGQRLAAEFVKDMVRWETMLQCLRCLSHL